MTSWCRTNSGYKTRPGRRTATAGCRANQNKIGVQNKLGSTNHHHHPRVSDSPWVPNGGTEPHGAVRAPGWAGFGSARPRPPLHKRAVGPPRGHGRCCRAGVGCAALFPDSHPRVRPPRSPQVPPPPQSHSHVEQARLLRGVGTGPLQRPQDPRGWGGTAHPVLSPLPLAAHSSLPSGSGGPLLSGCLLPLPPGAHPLLSMAKLMLDGRPHTRHSIQQRVSAGRAHGPQGCCKGH